MEERNKEAPDFDTVRAEFPVINHWIYLNIANKAPLPNCSQHAVIDFLNEFNEFGGKNTSSQVLVEQTRKRLANLLGADPHNIAFIKNTSEGLNIAAQAFNLTPGDNVIQADIDHPNQIYAWKRLEARGVELRWVYNRNGMLSIADFVKKIDNKTRVIAVSYVSFLNGIRLNLPALAEVCAVNNILLVVDAIQGIGVLATQLPSLGADVIVCGGHKGLLSLPGVGFLYCKEELISKLDPPFLARTSMTSEASSQLEIGFAPGARRFEIGSYNYLGLRILGESVHFLNRIGLSNIEKKVKKLTTYLIQLLEDKGKTLLTPRSWQARAGIVSIHEHDALTTAAFLRERGIIVSARGKNVLRISPHFYNTKDELDQLVSLL
jgi:selenocysteine lyase/cysteine desulfurase